MLNLKLENGIEVEIKEEMISIREIIQLCEAKIIKAISQIEGEIGYCVSVDARDKKFYEFNVYQNGIHKQAEYLDQISEYSWFTESIDAYELRFTLARLIELSVSEIAEQIDTTYKAYMNSIYNNLAPNDDILVGIYEVDEDTETVYGRIEDTVLEFNTDMQLVASYIIDTRHDQLACKEDIEHYEYKWVENDCKWIKK